MYDRLLPNYDMDDGDVVTWNKDGWFSRPNPGKRFEVELQYNSSTFKWEANHTIDEIYNAYQNDHREVIIKISPGGYNVPDIITRITGISYNIIRVTATWSYWTDNSPQTFVYNFIGTSTYNYQTQAYEDNWEKYEQQFKITPNTTSTDGGKIMRAEGGIGNGRWQLSSTAFPFTIDMYQASGSQKTDKHNYTWADVQLAINDNIPMYFNIEGIIVPVTKYINDISGDEYLIEGVAMIADVSNNTLKIYHASATKASDSYALLTSYESTTMSTSSWNPTTP